MAFWCSINLGWFRYARGALTGSINLITTGADDCLDSVRTALAKANAAEHPIVIVDTQQMQRANKVLSYSFNNAWGD